MKDNRLQELAKQLKQIFVKEVSANMQTINDVFWQILMTNMSDDKKKEVLDLIKEIHGWGSDVQFIPNLQVVITGTKTHGKIH